MSVNWGGVVHNVEWCVNVEKFSCTMEPLNNFYIHVQFSGPEVSPTQPSSVAETGSSR